MTRQAMMIKWSLYSLCAAAALLVQGLILVHLDLGGVHPFLLPAIAVIPATMERDGASVLYAVFFGLLCDLLMSVAGLACFYCLAFALAVAVARLFGGKVLASGLLCTLTAATAAMLLCGLLHLLVLAGRSSDVAVGTALLLTVKETALTLPFAALAHPMFRWVFRHTQSD